MERGAWQATVHRISESDTAEATEHARMHHFTLPPEGMKFPILQFLSTLIVLHF